MGEMRAAVEAGVPVFISECGICESSGDGRIDFASAAEWFSYLAKQKISYAVWSLSDKDETSAFFRPGTDPTKPIKDADLTVSGLWVRELIRGANPDMIPSPAASREKRMGGDSIMDFGLHRRGRIQARFLLALSCGNRGRNLPALGSRHSALPEVLRKQTPDLRRYHRKSRRKETEPSNASLSVPQRIFHAALSRLAHPVVHPSRIRHFRSRLQSSASGRRDGRFCRIPGVVPQSDWGGRAFPPGYPV